MNYPHLTTAVKWWAGFRRCHLPDTVEGDILTLVGGEGTAGGTYELHREAE